MMTMKQKGNSLMSELARKLDMQVYRKTMLKTLSHHPKRLANEQLAKSREYLQSLVAIYFSILL